ncbi:hypothetical protein BJ322DRAFT_1105488 [Thelephora terrestris]|uniref:DUF6535 domain-containing protein n=1 Tax=Thelephora terrestris TaxID=56493 RepID=A0A9P6LAL7_9AGAM|nr:hypothetical protein BJ322DRAFT_1105488 [Thelephora terrestris]
MSERPNSVQVEPRPDMSRATTDAKTLEDGVSGNQRKSVLKDEDEAASKRNNELNILLVIVGLLAATITSFIVYIQPQLQENSTDDTAALLRLLLYNTNQSIFTGESVPELPTWPGAPIILTIAQIMLYACLAGTLMCGLYAMLIKFLTDSNALGWKNRIVDGFTRWVFFVIYLLLSAVFFWTFVALTLQVPFLPSKAIPHFKKLI